jgi:hypothetical protein
LSCRRACTGGMQPFTGQIEEITGQLLCGRILGLG